MKMKKLLKEIGIILMVVIPLALVTNSLRPSGLRLVDTGIPMMQTVDTNDPVCAIPLDRAIEKYEREEALFIDTRSHEDYLAGHIKGAINLPDHHFDEWIDDFLSRTDPDIEIITYCNGKDCSLGYDVAEKLYQLGFERVSYLVNGLTKWQESALPVVSQKIPGS
jgi:rhodanese-related sulfurtransferase